MTRLACHRPTRTTAVVSLIALLVNVGFEVNGQDYEADSVYYTPIAKPVSTPVNIERHHRNVFQDTTSRHSPVYFFNFQFGHLFGDTNESVGREVTFTTSTVHGITLGRKLRAGLGMGFDMYYDWRAMPLFASVSWDLIGSRDRQAIYIQANYGWAFGVWRNGPIWEPDEAYVNGGAMFSPQIGYRINYRDLRLSLSLGAKMQHMETVYEYPSYYYLPDGSVVEGTPNRTTVSLDVSRFMINVSFGWH